MTTITPRSTRGDSRLPTVAPSSPPTVELTASTATTGQLTAGFSANALELLEDYVQRLTEMFPDDRRLLELVAAPRTPLAGAGTTVGMATRAAVVMLSLTPGRCQLPALGRASPGRR